LEKKQIKETMLISSGGKDEDDFSNKMSERHVRVAVIGNVDAGKS
jgi:polynucleotide 5'-kinase involved in rRNA processing